MLGITRGAGVAQSSTGTTSATRARAPARLRPPPAAILTYLGLLLALELLAEGLTPGQAPPARALMRWSLMVLAFLPVCGFIAWRSYQADAALAAGAERDLVRKLALTLTAEYDPERVPELMVRQVRELTGSRLVFLARPDGDGFRVETVAGDDPHRLVGQRLPIGPYAPGLSGEAIRSGKPAVLADTWSEAGLAARRELALSDRVRSTAAVPLLVRGEVVALIGLHADAVRQLGPAHAELLGLYAEQAAGPFENALLAASVGRLNAAEQLDQLKSELLSAVAHELRAPLAPMLGWSELLLTRDYSPEQARPMLENIHDGAQHLSVLVGDLLDLARGEAGRLTLEVQNLDLAALLEAAVAVWREQAPQHHFVVAVGGPTLLRADQHRLRQVLDNLLSNAVKYSPAGTRIFITARSGPDGRATVRVSDQGLGLTQEECARLFAKFYRTESARKHASGTGLGLALCRLILEAHGGEIRVESEGPGFGSAFTFSLPVDGPPDETREVGLDFAAIRS